MSDTIRLNGITASTETVSGTQGVFLHGLTLDTGTMSVQNTVIEQALSGFYYEWKYASLHTTPVDTTTLGASQQTINGVSGVFITNLDSSTPASVASDGVTLVNVFKGQVGGTICPRGRSGVN